MIQTKLFNGYFKGDTTKGTGKYVDVDVEINEFLSKYTVEIIDIKYAVTVSEDQTWNNALMIFKLVTSESSPEGSNVNVPV